MPPHHAIRGAEWYGYLSQPFFREPSDRCMDWFNPAYWSHGTGAYDSRGSIYSPSTFVVMQMISDQRCDANCDALETLDCDGIGFVISHAIFRFNLVLVAWSFFGNDRRTALAVPSRVGDLGVVGV